MVAVMLPAAISRMWVLDMFAMVWLTFDCARTTVDKRIKIMRGAEAFIASFTILGY